MALFILIKKKGQKRFLGAIPVKKGVTRSQLRKTFKLRKGLQFRIVDGKTVKKLLKNALLRSARKKRRKKKR